MNSAPPSCRHTHLLAASLALLLAGLCVAVGLWYCQRLEGRHIHALAGEFTEEKLQGIALQRRACQQRDLLMLYGSSELVKEMPNNANEFFANYPTGFRVFPVGKPGATSLTTLQRVASLGSELRGRKVAFSLSPGWFFTEVADPKYYEGNFSEMQGAEVAWSSVLSYELKRDIARRMLAFPESLENREFLHFALTRLARDTWYDRTLYALAYPLGKLTNAVARGQDHLEVALHILEEDEKLSVNRPRSANQRVVWSDVLKRAARFANAAAVQAKRNEVAKKRLPKASRNQVFMQTVALAQEWTDAELLLRTLRELGADPLLLSMPVEDIRMEVYGITDTARNAYTERLDALARKYGYPLRDFEEYEKDPTFLVDFLDHLSGSGWLYYNQALDDFFHNRLSRS